MNGTVHVSYIENYTQTFACTAVNITLMCILLNTDILQKLVAKYVSKIFNCFTWHQTKKWDLEENDGFFFVSAMSWPGFQVFKNSPHHFEQYAVSQNCAQFGANRSCKESSVFCILFLCLKQQTMGIFGDVVEYKLTCHFFNKGPIAYVQNQFVLNIVGGLGAKPPEAEAFSII